MPNPDFALLGVRGLLALIIVLQARGVRELLGDRRRKHGDEAEADDAPQHRREHPGRGARHEVPEANGRQRDPGEPDRVPEAPPFAEGEHAAAHSDPTQAHQKRGDDARVAVLRLHPWRQENPYRPAELVVGEAAVVLLQPLDDEKGDVLRHVRDPHVLQRGPELGRLQRAVAAGVVLPEGGPAWVHHGEEHHLKQRGEVRRDDHVYRDGEGDGEDAEDRREGLAGVCSQLRIAVADRR
mmetsp:Transcript_6258/g.17938  ORF Transcript_6258/g.17938 Transcript_6258/m.17938 type:complete len:239 (+) Transcript_6258:381-1097(+)